MKSKFTKIQKGNPHQLPKNLHTFPVMSISRFSNADGKVETYFIKQKKIVSLDPRNVPFTVKRLWDKRAEGFFKDIEDRYQNMIESTDFLRTQRISELDQRIISEMFATWKVRSEFEGFEDQTLNGVIPNRADPYSQDNHEELEAAGFITVRQVPEGETAITQVPGHSFAWPILHGKMGRILRMLSNGSWGLLSSTSAEFMCPDTFGKECYLPVSPKLLLGFGLPSEKLSDSEVKRINRTVLFTSKSNYIARDFDVCPRGIIG